MSPALSESYRTDAAMPAGCCSMEAKLGQNAGDRRRLLVGELNPDPLANHFGNLEKARRIAAEERQQLLGFQRTIRPPEGEINLRSVFSAQLFGSAQVPLFLIFLCGSFHGLFFGTLPFVSFCRSDQKTAKQGWPAGVALEGTASGPLLERAGEGERKRTGSKKWI